MKRGSHLVIKEFLYVQSTVEQIISIPVALRCIGALGIWRREKGEGTVSENKCLNKSLNSEIALD